MTSQEPFEDGEIIDTEFVPEDAETPLFKPEWHVFLYFGQRKFDEATQHLQFVELKDRLYHYVDRRNGMRYTVPEESIVKSHFKARRRAQVNNPLVARRAGGFFAVYGLVVLFTLLFSTLFSDGPMMFRNLVLSDVFLHISVYTFLIAPILIGLWYLFARDDVMPLPEHQMFLTDLEVEQERVRRQQKEALIAAATAAFAIHEYNKHERHALAQEIADAQAAHEHRHSFDRWW